MGKFTEENFYNWLDIFTDEIIVGVAFNTCECPVAQFAKHLGYRNVSVGTVEMSGGVTILNFPVNYTDPWIEEVVSASDSSYSYSSSKLEVTAGRLREKLGHKRVEPWGYFE